MQYLEQPHAVFKMLLNDGDGLTLGPDSDALLNFCDMPLPAQSGARARAGASSSADAAANKGKAVAVVSDEESSDKVWHSPRLLHLSCLCGGALPASLPGLQKW